MIWVPSPQMAVYFEGGSLIGIEEIHHILACALRQDESVCSNIPKLRSGSRGGWNNTQ